jgi:hypothetical protein
VRAAGAPVFHLWPSELHRIKWPKRPSQSKNEMRNDRQKARRVGHIIGRFPKRIPVAQFGSPQRSRRRRAVQ